jgi:DNA-binding IclR family transcriptional regulator
MSSVGGRQPQAVRSALEVLFAVAEAGPGITAQEISRTLGISPATTYRLVNLLVGEEYLVRLPDLTGFALGARFTDLVNAAIASHPTPTRENAP